MFHATRRPQSKFLNFFGERIKSVDKFGFPVSLTFKREVTYKSTFGGFMSLLSILATLAYLAA